MTKTLSGTLAGLGAASLWGVMYVVSKVVMETVPPFVLVTSRLVLGAGTLALFVIRRGRPVVPRSHILQILMIGLIGYGISLGFQFYGTMLSTASNGAMVTATTPAFILPIAALILGERITLQNIIALTLSTVGVLVVVNPFRSSIEQGYLAGNLCLVTAAITWALYSVLVRKMTAIYDVLTFSMYAFLGGLPVSVSLGVWELTQQPIGTLTWGILGGVLFLGIISTALAMFLWNTAFKHLNAGIAGLTFFAQPLVGAALGALLLHDKLSLSFIFGGVLIMGGILFSSRQN